VIVLEDEGQKKEQPLQKKGNYCKGRRGGPLRLGTRTTKDAFFFPGGRGERKAGRERKEDVQEYLLVPSPGRPKEIKACIYNEVSGRREKKKGQL